MPSQPRRILFIVFEDVLLLDFTGPLQVFELACENRPLGVCPYEWDVASIKGGSIRTSAGVTIQTTALSNIDIDTVDTLLIGGGIGVHKAAANPTLVDWIRANAAKVRRVCSVCTGAFVLAEAGLLEGRRAVTHWGSCGLLTERYPQVSVAVDPIFIHDRGIWTSAGASAGIDLALALLEEDEGHREAMRVARRLVVFLKRPGGQAQFSGPLTLQGEDDGTFASLFTWIQDNLTEDLKVEALADRCGMTPRTFARLFREKTGATPARIVERFRVEAARRSLEQTERTMKDVAVRSGFQDEERMRRAFRRQLAVGPRDYRERFRKNVA
jgi:transcriptional regulator GlxA family with amidase domain